MSNCPKCESAFSFTTFTNRHDVRIIEVCDNPECYHCVVIDGDQQGSGGRPVGGV